MPVLVAVRLAKFVRPTRLCESKDTLPEAIRGRENVGLPSAGDATRKVLCGI